MWNITNLEWALIIMFFFGCFGYDRLTKRLKRIEYLLKELYGPARDGLEEKLEDAADRLEK